MCRKRWFFYLVFVFFASAYAEDPSLTITFPDGGENFMGGAHKWISWWWTDSIDQVDLHYSLNNGANWTNIESNLTNEGHHSWIVPQQPSAQCLVRVRDSSSPATYDISDSVFRIRSLNIRAPSGDEEILAGEVFLITWDSLGLVAAVRLEYSTNSGTSWNLINGDTADDGIYHWYTPPVHSSNCRIRISDRDDSTDYDNSPTFWISKLILQPPLSGDLLAGDDQEIAWLYEGTVADVNIDYSGDDGDNWTFVETTENDGSYIWQVPVIHSRQCKVRISDAANAGVSDSRGQFAILKVMVTSPDGSEVFDCDSIYDVEWLSHVSVTGVDVQYSVDNGSHWYWPDPCNIGNDDLYSWHVWTRSSDQCLIRVTDAADPCAFDTSNDTFTCLAVPEIVSFTGGELCSGTTQSVQWQSLGIIDNVDVQYSWSGVNWVSVYPPNVGNMDSYSWIVPEITWYQWRLKLADASFPAAYDISGDYFTTYVCQLPPGPDLQANCYIEEPDLDILTGQWLERDDFLTADINRDYSVDLFDFSELAYLWLECGNPYDQSCNGLTPWPDCWNYPTWCYGDADGDGYVGDDDFAIYQSAFQMVYPDPLYNPCADFNQDVVVNVDDWPVMRDWYGKYPPTDCSDLPGVPWPLPPYWTGYEDCTTDNDGDGYGDPNNPTCSYFATDCDDTSPAVNPGADEVCDDLVDNDCDGLIDCDDPDCGICRDIDDDGYGDPVHPCCQFEGFDCDDINQLVNPGQSEICDGLDNDCDSVIDNKDVDGDNYIDEVCGGDDCDDAESDVNPVATENCVNGIDDDCDEAFDCDDSDCACFDGDGDGYGDPANPCCTYPEWDCDDGATEINPSAAETCGDGLDNDCDGTPDNKNADGDNYIDEACGGEDCDDSAPEINPDASEICGDSLDNDCDGTPDNKNTDGDNYIDEACGGEDCDDSAPEINPDAIEICDDLVDNDCDSATDCDDSDCQVCIDGDSDGYGDPAHVCCTYPQEDCDDLLGQINPGADEICDDTIDNDCDELLDCDDNDCEGTELCPPSCWDCLTQCYTDSNCDGLLDLTDLGDMALSFNKCYGNPAYNPCSDADRNGIVDMNDLAVLAGLWPTNPDPPYPTLPADCVPGGTWPPINLPPWCGGPP